jgi:hypothetical protein
MKADWDKHQHGAEWTGFVVAALKTSTLIQAAPADGATFWKGYAVANEAGREQFWLMLISAIAKEESNFDPNCVFEEPPPLDQKSIGLMQLSTTDKAYGCNFPDENSVKDPERNLSCAVRILDRLVNRDGRIGGDEAHRRKGAAAYWSTLRVPKPGKRDARSYVIGRTSVL